MPVRIVDGDGRVPGDALADGIRAAAAAKADVIPVASGTDQPGKALRAAIEVHSRGALITAQLGDHDTARAALARATELSRRFGRGEVSRESQRRLAEATRMVGAAPPEAGSPA